MSTIEEAREQARTALSEDGFFNREQATIVSALLDATEPPTCSCQQVQECYDDGSWARSHVVVPDPECEAHTTTEPPAQAEPAEDEREATASVIRLFFQNWRAIGRVSPSLEMSIDSLEGAVDDLIELDAPKDCDYHEGFEEGVKFGRAGSGPRPITDEDEREALVMTLYANGMAGNLHEPLRRQAVQKWADAILAAGYSKGPRPITDEMVAAADFAIMPYWGERYPSGSLTTEIARAALEAAEEARR